MTDFDQLQNELVHLGALTDAAEAHGTLCGLLLGGQDFSVWLRYSLEEIPDVRDLQARSAVTALKAVYDEARQQINAADMSFELLLPDEDIELSQRLLALAGWSRGFLYGMAVNGETALERLSEQGKECMDDLLQISQLDHDAEQNDEAETDFAEIVEHVRLSVIYINDDLNPLTVANNQLH